MSRATCLVTRTSTTMVLGVKSRTTVQCGTPTRSQSAGLLTAMDTGTGLALGAGHGLTMRLGASLRSITDAGLSSAALGVGARARSMLVPFTDLRSLAFSAADLASALVLAVESAGSRSDSANRSTRGITPAEIISAM